MPQTRSTPAAEDTVLEIECRSRPEKGCERRSWNIKITRSGPGWLDPRTEPNVPIEDPLATDRYKEYEESLRTPSRRGSPSPTDSSCFLHSQTSRGARSGFLAVDLPVLATGPGSDAGSSAPLPASEMKAYRQMLLSRLNLSRFDLKHPIDCVKVKIYEELGSTEHDEDDYSIHSLFWEVLEHDEEDCTPRILEPEPRRHGAQRTKDEAHGPAPQLKIQICRILVVSGQDGDLPRCFRSPAEPIRMLLVIARSFQRDGSNDFMDLRSVVCDNIIKIGDELRRGKRPNRLLVDVVRPGTRQELARHLPRGAYDMVHFDVHGTVDRQGVPQLLFARPNSYGSPRRGLSREIIFDEESFEFESTEEVAKLLMARGVRAVALSACLSSFAQGRPLSNMCHVFARYGVKAVTGMSFTVKGETAEAYYEGFYRALAIDNRSFVDASYAGRRQVRELQRQSTWPKETAYHTIRRNCPPGASEQPEEQGPGEQTFLVRPVPVLAASAAVVESPPSSVRPRPPELQHSVGIMALEDRLKWHRQLFIQVDSRFQTLPAESLREYWLKTSFAATVEVVSARDFQWSFSLSIRDAWQNPVAFLAELMPIQFSWAAAPEAAARLEEGSPSREAESISPPPRAVLIIRDMDAVVHESRRLSNSVLRCLSNYIQNLARSEPSGIYLIMTGSPEVDFLGQAWPKATRLGDICPWSRAPLYKAVADLRLNPIDCI